MDHKLQKLAIAVGDVVNLVGLKSELAIQKKALIEKSSCRGGVAEDCVRAILGRCLLAGKQ